ncbi:SdiA-regulated domain-containing protein [Methylomagnum sp.]
MRGDTDGDGDIDQILMYGGRSFSILDASGNRVFDSADIIERIAATLVTTAVFDDRSDNKGPEPEGVTVGVVGGRTYAFVGLERAHLSLVFDITDPANVSYTGTAQRAGDLNPEGALFIPAADSPTGQALYVASNEASNNLSVFSVAEAPAYSLQLLHYYGESGMLGVDTAPIMGALIDRFDDQYANTLVLGEGDSFIPGPWLVAGADPSLNAVAGIGATALGRPDIAIMNAFGTDASALGNHEFDLGSPVLQSAITASGAWAGAQFPLLTANLNFSADSSLRGLADASLGGTASNAYAGQEASAIKGKIAPYAVVAQGGEKIGLIGITTFDLLIKSSPNGTAPKDDGDPSTTDLQEVAVYVQAAADALAAQGVNKIVMVDQLDTLDRNKALAPLVSGIDVMIAGGGHERMGDSTDTPASFPGHDADVIADAFPIVAAGADGKPTLIATTDTEYTYLGRLLVDFNAQGEVIVPNLSKTINGAYSATESTLQTAYGSTASAAAIVASSPIGSSVQAIVNAIDTVVNTKDSVIYGYTSVYLEGDRVHGRTQEVNLGDVTADANRAAAALTLPAQPYIVSLKNGGGLRASIGAIDEDGAKVPPTATDVKPAGAISQLDIENALRFDNKLMAFDTTPQGLLNIFNFAAGLSSGPGQQSGGYPQVGGIRFSYDPDNSGGAKIDNVSLVDADGKVVARVVEHGAVLPGAPASIAVVALNFTANGGDGYPIKANGENFRYLLADGTLSAAIDEALDFTAAANLPANTLGEQKAFQDYLTAHHATPATAYGVADTPASADLRIENLNFRATDAVFQGSAINGGNGDDPLTPTAGDDSIDGGAGQDTVTFGGNQADASILQTGLGAWKVTTATGGTDQLSHVETLQFADGALQSSIDLATYIRVGRYDLPEPTRTTAPAGSVLAQEVSGVTYNWDTDTLFVVGDGGTSVVQVSKTGQLIDAMTLAAGTSPQGTEFYDPEGLTYIGGGQFVMTEERDRHAVEFTYHAGTTLNRTDAKTVALGTNVGNVGLEGLSYDPLTGGYVFVKEASPQGIFQTTIDFTAGTASNGSPTTVNSANLFDPALAGVADFADVYALSNIPALNGLSQASHLLALSQESGRIVNIDRTGTISSSLAIQNDPGNPLSVADQQHEGLTMDRSGTLYVVSENGGGDFDHPQLWVYAPAQVPNAAPTGLALLNQASAVLENASTATRLKVADLALTDDGLGTNNFSLTGPDAGLFEVNGFALYLKAGTVLDFESKAAYAVSVNVDDPAVGATPDLTANFTLAVTDVVNENPAQPTLFVSEVAPWSSGNGTIAADWFEVTNTGSSPVDLTGWKMDDSSNTFAAAVALTGVSSIAPGESVIFIETADLPAAKVAFIDTWFGGSAPASLQIGGYSGGGVGLGTGGDAVNLFDAVGVPQAGVTFGASTTSVPFLSFNNAAGLNNAAITALSATGVNGAFAAPNSTTTEIGSPGTVGRLFISEVAPWSSGNSPVGADWFEMTNTTAFPVDLGGWKMDDASGSPAAAVALNGVASVAPGESVIFIESADPAAAKAAFINTWFGGNAPASLQIGTYTGAGIGLGAGGDAVHLYDTNNLLRASVSFGASPTGPFASFDNAAGLNGAAIASLSVVGTHAAFAAVNDGAEIGSPGEIAPVNDAPVAVDDSLSAVEAGSGNRVISFASLLANDLPGPANESGQSLTIVAVGNAVGGTVGLSGTDVIFTPAPGTTGTVRFDYTARDNGTTRGVDDFRTDEGTASFAITPASTGGDTGGDTGGGTTPTPTPSPEDQVPSLNGGAPGDGNGDGIADSQQANVASLTVDPSIQQTGAKSYVTLSGSQGLPLTQVQALPAPTDAPAGVSFPLGRFSFQVGGVTPGGTANLSLFVDGTVPVNGYWKLNPQTQQWEDIATKIETVGSKTRIDFAIQDGGPFDADGAANGAIQDPGGPGFQANRAPTVAHELADQSASQGRAFSFQVPADAFADADSGDVLGYAASLADGAALPAWLAFDPATRQFGGTPGNGDVGSLSVKVTATDGGGASTSDTFALSIANVNDAPTGGVTLSGTATQGQTLTAANTLADADGLGVITYHWLRAGTDTGATGASYVLTQADVGKAISVKSSYTDALGSAESVTSPATSPAANVNDAPTGGVTLSGTATQGQTLTAANTLADADGLGAITYHWLRAGADTGATGAAYALTQADVGKAISVKASYTDALGSAESVTSPTASPVANVNDAPTLAHAIAAQSAQENQGFRFTVPADSFADADAGDSLSFGAGLANGGALPGWLAFDAATRTFSGTPGFTDAGSLQLRLTATDRGGASVNGDFGLTVADTALPAGARFVAAGSNRLDGNNKADALVGLSGNDKLNGKGGNDQLYGGAGRDELKGGAGNDGLDGGAGDDLLHGQDGRDILIGGAGDDLLNGGAGVDVYRYLAKALGLDDLLAGDRDTLAVTKGDKIAFDAAVWAGFTKDGVALDDLSKGAKLAGAIDADSNIALVGRTLQIDLNGDGQFGADQDFAIEIMGQAKLGVDAGGDFLVFG